MSEEKDDLYWENDEADEWEEDDEDEDEDEEEDEDP